MSKTFISAKKRVEKKKRNHNSKKWWIIKFKEYKIPLYLLPIAIFIIPYNETNKAIDKRIKWSDKKATKIFDIMLPKVLSWSEKDEYYYGFFRRTGFFSLGEPLFGYKKWFNKYRHKLLNFLVNEYENELYIKNIEKGYEWYFITFKERTNEG